jgi:ADP-ribose pyrophosphatase
MRTVIPPAAHPIPAAAQRVFQGKIFAVYQWPQTLFDGTTATFEMLKRPDTVVVLPIKDEKLVVIKERQPGSGPAAYGLPGGRHDVEAETELEAAQREVREETGLGFKSWKLLQVWQPHTKIDWLVYLFVAYDYSDQVPQVLDAGEEVTVELVDLEQARALADQGGTDMPKDLLHQVQALSELPMLPQYRPDRDA